MTTRTLFIVIFAACSLLFLEGCQRLKNQDTTRRFDETFRQYSKHLRWGHYRQLAQFMTPEHAPGALEKADKYRERRVSSVHASQWIFNENMTQATGLIEIRYYLTDRGVIKDASQKQTWIREKDNWLLDNGLPDLP